MKKEKLFISLEGGEGTGKTTVAKLLGEHFNNRGFPTITTKEPFDCKGFCGAINNIIMDKPIAQFEEILLFNYLRSQHVKEIRGWLREDKIVITDRFTDSTLVYQGESVDESVIKVVNNFATQGLEPDYVFIFDLNEELAQKRIKDNNRETNRFDDQPLEYHKNIRKRYLELAATNTDKYIVIDASKTPQEIAEEISLIIFKTI